MQPLKAIDAIAPAFTRTHQILFNPFRLGRSWKLAATQYLGLMGAFFFPLPLALLFLPFPLAQEPRLRVTLVATLTFVMLPFLVLFYVGVRLQFVNLQMILTRQQFIAPLWRPYGRRVWPVLFFKVLLGTLLFLLMLPLFRHAAAELLRFILTLPRPQPGEPPQPPDPQLFAAFFSHLIGFYALLLSSFLIFKTVSTLFEDFALPFFTLEEIPLFESLRRGARVLIADPIQSALYLLLKFALSLVGFIAQYVSTLLILIPFFLIGIIFGAIGFGVSAALHPSSGSASILIVIAAAFFYLLFMLVMFWYQLGSYGYLFTLLEAYSLYFLAGRYPLLASLLEPAPGAPFTPPPVFPSPEEDNDEDGPTLPMDPAVA